MLQWQLPILALQMHFWPHVSLFLHLQLNMKWYLLLLTLLLVDVCQISDVTAAKGKGEEDQSANQNLPSCRIRANRHRYFRTATVAPLRFSSSDQSADPP